MSRVVLHIGAPKTGTTYLQHRLARNVKTLAQHDVHFPTRVAAGDRRGSSSSAPPSTCSARTGAASPATPTARWDVLVRRVRGKSGTTIVSHEILAPGRRRT